jgi:hypothetical protein
MYLGSKRTNALSSPRGEQQAAAIEANLTNLESKLDALLASIEAGSSGAPKIGGGEDDHSRKEQQPGEK